MPAGLPLTAAVAQRWVFTPVTPGSSQFFITSFNGLACGQTYLAPAGLCAANTNAVAFSGPQIATNQLQAPPTRCTPGSLSGRHPLAGPISAHAAQPSHACMAC